MEMTAVPNPPPRSHTATPPVERWTLGLRFARLILVLWLAASTVASAANPPDQILFNGRDLVGWSSWLVDTMRTDPRGVFTVTNGTLRISGEGLGYLATETEWSDYRLTLEWRWGQTNFAWGDRIGRARDSGVFLNAVGPDGNSEDGNGAFMSAIECNLFEGACGDLLLIRGRRADGSLLAPRLSAEVAAENDADGWPTWLRGGKLRTLERWGRLNWALKSPQWKDVTGFRGAGDVEKPPGEWNHLECDVQPHRLRVRLNGVQVNEATDVFPARGKILLQCEGSEILFRHITLKSLVGRDASP